MLSAQSSSLPAKLRERTAANARLASLPGASPRSIPKGVTSGSSELSSLSISRSRTEVHASQPCLAA
eukprot:7423324-Lingulodinium_polyedra.AAC.1